jgi:hypothetical protein
MPRLKVSSEDMDLLTEEERIGLKEHLAERDAEEAEEDAEIAAAAAGGEEEKPAKAEKPEKPEKKPAKEVEEAVEEVLEPPVEEEDEEEIDAGAEDEPEEGEEGAEEGDEAQEEEEPAVVAKPAKPAILPADKLSAEDEARFGTIDTLLDDIATKFDDGELTAREMREQTKPLEAELAELRERRAIAKMSGQNVVNAWYGSTVPLFLAEHTEYKEGSGRHKLLDTYVKELQTAQPDNPTDPKILVDAHAKVIAEFGEVAGAEKPVKKANGKQRELPPNLGAIPAADQTVVTVPNKFIRLEKLKGAEYEKALARLSTADRDLYLQGG